MTIELLSWLLWVSFSLFSFLIGVSSGQCLNDQRLLLLQLNNTLNFLPSWDPNLDCCNWSKVVCDGSGHVISLNLDNLRISGDLENATGLFGLQYLQRLNLAYNFFTNATIPMGLENLANLEYLNLSNSGFGGQIPIQLSKLTRLVTLDLSNQFQGQNPFKLENPDLKFLLQNLTGLRELYLDGVNISSKGKGEDWCQSLSSSLPNLRNLSLRGCGLSGPLHDSLLQLQHLSVLRLDRNNLQTSVPLFFANFSSLRTLSLSFCSLQGTFPDRIFQVPTLQSLDLTNNGNLSGTISQFPQNGSLTSLVLSYTNFSGSLPDSISNLNMLSRIELSNCNFTGPIPSSIGNLNQLVYLDFSFNSFTGQLPRFHSTKKLAYLDLSRNDLTGTLVPNHFEGLSNLVFVNIGHNTLTGTIPESLFGLQSLQNLDLSNNRFSGQIVSSSWNSPNLDTLDLSSNQLEGSIPGALFNQRRLKVLLLSQNSFSGTVDLGNIQKLSNLSRLELGDNNLSVSGSSRNSTLSKFPQLSRLNLAGCNLGDFPDLLKNQSKLVFLDLSRNQITGEVPSWIWEMQLLVHLNLSFNQLVDLQKPVNMPGFLSVLDFHNNSLLGELPIPPASVIYVDYSDNKFQQPIPYDIGDHIAFASFFSVARNQLYGTIPRSLCNATNLQVLDLSSNNLSGNLPSCLVGNITVLAVLNLRENKISGDIPNTFSVNCSLRTLDLRGNELGGKMPASLANCTSLEVVNVGNNHIEDGFPCMLKNVSTLRVLVLRKNKFYGNFGCSGVKENWSNLQIIDVASNKFSGPLSAKCISKWSGMSLSNDVYPDSSHLGVKFLDLNNFYYQDTVTVTTKGMELELVKILTVFTSVDFSDNKFLGEIPVSIGNLIALYALNFSQNNLSGSIPMSIGNLTKLESLDLSNNQLSGQIPQVLTSLTFLSFLNLSYNHLVGTIPVGHQFLTFDASSFLGNSRLCGFPLKNNCNSDSAAVPAHGAQLMRKEFDWQFILTGLGYGVGTAFIIAPLAFCKEWREHCNNQLDQFLKQIIPRYGFSYERYDGKVKSMEDIEYEPTDDDDDDEVDDTDTGQDLSRGRYCVFCTKMDTQMKIVIHNPKCTCHYSPPTFSSSVDSSSSLLVIYHTF